ncbi:MAG: ABC transporter ATP-binding protein [Culicoidibacterales bacterium]
MSYMVFENIYKVYGDKYLAIDDFNLTIEKNEFIALIGPSGCGKSTLLRMIAGLEQISDGKLLVEGSLVNNVHAKDRNIAMVFQNYALYPHMTIFDNIAFGLKIRKMAKNEIEKRVEDAAKLLDLGNQVTKMPSELSGGQRQRVALGRGLVQKSKILLMDEPLSNLDAKLRHKMRREILALHKTLGVTTVYVTHDQIEAMTMADRIVVLNNGEIQQIGTPKQLYEAPQNIFVARFIGEPEMNLSICRFDGTKLVYQDNEITLSGSAIATLGTKYIDRDVYLGIRPSDVYVENLGKVTYPETIFSATANLVELRGDYQVISVEFLGLEDFAIKANTHQYFNRNQVIDFALNPNKFHFFDVETEKAIRENKLEQGEAKR